MSSELNGFDKTRQPNGEIIYTDRTTGREAKFYTAQCIHCGLMWIVQPGSGRKRGYCMNCRGMLCGDQVCMTHCRHVEGMLEDSEKKQNIQKLEDEKKADEILKKNPGLYIM